MKPYTKLYTQIFIAFFLSILFGETANGELNICPRMPVAAAVTNEWISAISASGAVTQSQPAFSNISGNIANSQLPTQIQLGNGSSSAPSYSFTNSTNTGWFLSNTTPDVSMAVNGELAMDNLYVNSSQTNIAFNQTASSSISNPFTATGTYNGVQYFQYGNLSQGAASGTVTEVINGPGNLNNATTLENYAYANTTNQPYLSGSSAVSATSFQGGLYLMSENSSGQIGFNVGGRTLATQRALLTTSNFTLNANVDFQMTGSTSGTITFAPPATITSYTMTWPAAVASTAGSVVTSSTGGVLSFTAQLPVANGGTGVATASANTVFAGPTSGSAAAPAFRALVGADLPNPGASSLGGVESLAATSHQWINTISTSGVPSSTQPAFTDISGNISTSQMNSGTSASSTTFWRGDGTWANSVPSGTVVMYGSSTAPAGWLNCDGSSYSTTTYAALYAVIGYTYGGSGSSFNVPDFRGIFPRGAGTNGTLKNANGTAFSGTAGSYQNDGMQGHIHTVTASVTANGAAIYAGASSGSGANSYTNAGHNTGGIQELITSVSVTDPVTDGTNGTPRYTTETRPANLGIYFIIKQ